MHSRFRCRTSSAGKFGWPLNAAALCASLGSFKVHQLALVYGTHVVVPGPNVTVRNSLAPDRNSRIISLPALCRSLHNLYGMLRTRHVENHCIDRSEIWSWRYRCPVRWRRTLTDHALSLRLERLN